MSFIDTEYDFKKVEKNFEKQESRPATYSVKEDLFQINSYSTTEKQEKAQASQTIQFDLKGLKDFFSIVKNEYPSLFFSDNSIKIEKIRVSLLDRNGEPQYGLKWGQREGREPNQAYIQLPIEVYRSDFFPRKPNHFIIKTDDGQNIVFTRAQKTDEGTALQTPKDNSLLGKYLRTRMGIPLGNAITKDDILRYGCSDLTFFKVGNQYFMDFSGSTNPSFNSSSFPVYPSLPFSLSTFSKGNPFSHRYLTSLLAKPFVILAGNSGTGKTRIARNLAAWLERKDAMGRANHLLAPVGADWTDNTKLLGYFNPLANDGAGHYVKTEILRFLEDAGANPHIPFFLILDEMNLSRVERYFSDFLSIMETVSYGEGSPDVFLELDGYPGGKLKFPRNLFITGTVNVDETTYMFSPKVLDRANVIEFKPESADVLGNFISDSAAQAIEPAETGMAESFLSLAQKIRGSSRLAEGVKIEEVEGILRAVYEAVQDTDFAFAFRTTKEMRHYVNAAYAIEPTASIVSVLDQQVLQKILPKIHGSRSQLKAVLERLAKVCHEQQLEESGRKIASMQRRLESSQFTSFM